MENMRRLLGSIDAVNEWVGRISSFLVMFMGAVIIYEIVSRRVFDAPTTWASEMANFFFGAYIMLCGGYCLLHLQHVTMDILYNRFSRKTRAILNLITSVLFFSFCGALLWTGSNMAWESLQLRETTPTTFRAPIYPIKFTIPLGAALLILQGLAKFIRDFALAVKKEP